MKEQAEHLKRQPECLFQQHQSPIIRRGSGGGTGEGGGSIGGVVRRASAVRTDGGEEAVDGGEETRQPRREIPGERRTAHLHGLLAHPQLLVQHATQSNQFATQQPGSSPTAGLFTAKEGTCMDVRCTFGGLNLTHWNLCSFRFGKLGSYR